jgi:glycosyltransferase involved in cell wall biosynthesis
MKISVVVPAFNEQKLIGATLRALKDAATAFQQRGWEIELIVCNNNSTDATEEVARAEGATVVFEPVNQIGRARNTGAAAATGDWLVFVDADSRPTAALFSDVADAITSGKCLAGGCTVRYDERHLVADVLTSLWNIVSRVRKWAAGSFIFCETSAFRKIGGFDTALFAAEEIDLSKRLNKLAKESGKKVVILHRNPMQTSARKMRIYSSGELLRFLGKALLRPRATVTNREACSPWYDGRR